MTTPIRLRVNSTRSPTAIATAAARQTISWYRITTPASVIFAPAPKNMSTV